MKGTIFFLLFIFINGVCYAQHDLEYYFKQWQNPLPTAEKLNDVHFINDLTGYAVGNFGVVIKTVNGGVNWSFKTISDTTLNSVFVIGSTIHAVGGTYDGQNRRAYFKSGNAGIQFSNLTAATITEPDDNTRRLNTIFFTDINTGYAGATDGKIYKTTNGGSNWSMQNSPVTASIDKINFPPTGSALIGYATGGTGADAFVVKTTDGGMNWNGLNIPSIPDGSSLGAIDFLDADNGFVTGGGSLTPGSFALKTTNGGNDWTFIDVNGINSEIRYTIGGGVKMVTQDLIYAVGIMANTVRTTNGGISWQKIFPESSYNFPSAAFTGISFGENFLFAVGAGGSVAKIEADSIRFINGEILMGMNAVAIEDYTGFAVGGGQRTNPSGHTIKYPYIVRTYGFIPNTFVPELNMTGFILHGVAVYAGVLFACGENGVVLKSSNAHFNFDIETVNIGADSTELLSAAYGVEVNTFLIAGEGKMYKTTNAGASWTFTDIPAGKVNEFTTGYGLIYAVSDGGFILKSTDAGTTWQEHSLPGTNYTNGIYFLNQFTGWTCGDMGNIAKTTNGGVNWTALTSGVFSSSMNSVYFIDELRGFAFGSGGLMLYTTDGGANWSRDFLLTNNDIRQFKFRNRYLGFGITPYGGVFTVWIIEPHVENNYSEIPDDFDLLLNFPNPFNPVTNIKFVLSQDSEVTLNIYNSLGEEVYALFRAEQMTKGTYNLSWDASGYASGIYFCKLITGSGSQTRKMILLR